MKRKIIQLYSALLFNAHLKGLFNGELYRGNTKFACVPGLNCYSCPAAIGSCPLGALQNALASVNHRISWYVLGIIALYGVILGRTVCGWLCPFGLIQELLYKIPTHKIAKSKFTRLISYFKYIILFVLVIFMPLYFAMPSFCKYICPAGTLSAINLLSNNSDMLPMLGIFFTSKFIIMIFLALVCIFCYRSFCRFICPLGAIYGFFNRFNVIGVKLNENLCNHCGQCVIKCKMDVRFVGDHECINCGECANVCNQKAISFKKYMPVNRVISVIALIVLLIALIFYNVKDSDDKQISRDLIIGSEIGQKLPDFKIKCIDNTDFQLSENLGKIVIINLWATYCAPCIKELPYFDALYREHEKNLEIIAVHSSLVIDSPEEYLKKHDFKIKFAVDTNDNLIWKIVNGSSAMPQTIILNRNGEVIYNQIGSVTPEMLKKLYQNAI